MIAVWVIAVWLQNTIAKRLSLFYDITLPRRSLVLKPCWKVKSI
ncbi:hypothetical protein ACIWOS_03115 [Avibacterium paragallinarum]